MKAVSRALTRPRLKRKNPLSLSTHQLVVDRVHQVRAAKLGRRKRGVIGDGGQAEAAGHDVDDL